VIAILAYIKEILNEFNINYNTSYILSECITIQGKVM
jgi:hypothetical protein